MTNLMNRLAASLDAVHGEENETPVSANDAPAVRSGDRWPAPAELATRVAEVLSPALGDALSAAEVVADAAPVRPVLRRKRITVPPRTPAAEMPAALAAARMAEAERKKAIARNRREGKRRTARLSKAARDRRWELTRDELLSVLSYDPKTGIFRWVDGKQARGGVVPAGTEAGSISTDNEGRKRKTIGLNRAVYPAHHLAWLASYGCWPSKALGFANLDPTDCRLMNLIEKTPGEIGASARLRRDSASGVKGVYWDRDLRKWVARIGIDGKQETIGAFEDRAEARRAYDRRALEARGSVATTNAKAGVLPAAALSSIPLLRNNPSSSVRRGVATITRSERLGRTER